MTGRDAGYAPYEDGVHPPYYYDRYVSSTKRAPQRPMFAPPRTISELTGPVYSENEVQEGRTSWRGAATASWSSAS